LVKGLIKFNKSLLKWYSDNNMAKKNNPTIKRWILQNFFAIAAVVVAFANIWIASKLAPIAQDIDVIRSEVLANEQRIEVVEVDSKEVKKEIRDDLKEIRGSIDSINEYLRE